MRCLVCGAEMQLVEVIRDNTMMVPGYEHHTLQCSGCPEVERRLIFNRDGEAPAVKPVSPVAAPPASTPPPAEPVPPLAEPLPSVAAPPAESLSSSAAPPAPPVEPVRSVTPPPAAIKPGADNDFDEGELLLRRAIEMVRAPRGSQPTKGLTDGTPATPAALARSMQAKKSLTGRIVRIQRDPDEASYVAKDTQSGLSVLRHQDSARLRAMCDRIGWQVVDG